MNIAKTPKASVTNEDTTTLKASKTTKIASSWGESQLTEEFRVVSAHLHRVLLCLRECAERDLNGEAAITAAASEKHHHYDY